MVGGGTAAAVGNPALTTRLGALARDAGVGKNTPVHRLGHLVANRCLLLSLPAPMTAGWRAAGTGGG